MGKTKNLNTVHVKFVDSKYDYSTNVSFYITEESAREYFKGRQFELGDDKGYYMVTCKDIEFIDKNK
jgi:NOL1/NOP2/fmu family ribosome biogenesis protein